MTFEELNLAPAIVKAVLEQGYETPTPIQAQAIPAVLTGKDLLAGAQTGTGKTAAFSLPMLHRLTQGGTQAPAGGIRALILTPTRELAAQIEENIRSYAKYLDVTTTVIFGGVGMKPQIDRIRKGVDILVATPGRLLDLQQQGFMDLSQVEVLVLDEADRMLDMGFIPDVRRIVRGCPPKDQRQTLLFSATFNYDVRILIDQWTKDPLSVVIEPESVATDRVEQRAYLVAAKEKYQLLERVLREEKPELCIIFANRRDLTRNLCDKLMKHGHKAVLLSGEVSQEKRIKTLERFRAGQVNILVATDVAGRGIHVDGVSHVINYTLPEDPQDYVHRIGRTGRAGAKGVSISFVSEDDAFELPGLEKYLGTKLELTQP